MTKLQWTLICRFMICVLAFLSHRDPKKGIGSFDYGGLVVDIADSIHTEGEPDASQFHSGSPE